MAGQHLKGNTSGRRVDEVDRAGSHPVVLAGSAFALGLVTGLLLKVAGRQIYELARGSQWHREYERTITFDENLPDSLERREPTPQPGQPRYGGTGAIGVSPTAVDASRSRETGDTPDKA